MNVVEVADAVKIYLDARVSNISSRTSSEELTTSGCSLILQLFGRRADEAQGWAEASWAKSRKAGSRQIMLKRTLGCMMIYFREA